MATPASHNSLRKGFRSLFNHPGIEPPTGDLREVLLVVATLIAAVTFQAGVNPPGGVWQDGKDAGRAIYAKDPTAFYVFLSCNTLALSSSILLIISLTWCLPFFLEVVVATISMVMTYGASIFAITPKKSRTQYLLFIAAGPVIARIIIQIYKHIVLPRSSEGTSNSETGPKQQAQPRA